MLVLVTSTLWFTVAYMSPCRQLPGQASTTWPALNFHMHTCVLMAAACASRCQTNAVLGRNSEIAGLASTASRWFATAQEDLKYFEASEDADEEFYAGGGQFRRHDLEHFPQLWCANGTYSVYGQVQSALASSALHCKAAHMLPEIALHDVASCVHAEVRLQCKRAELQCFH